MDAAIDRAKSYVDAGADAIFPEAMQDANEFESFRKAIDIPMMANMTEFGKSPLLSAKQLEDMGYNLVIFPVTTMRLAMGAISGTVIYPIENNSMRSRERNVGNAN